MVFAFKRSKILFVGVSALMLFACNAPHSYEKPDISIVYNVDNCLECNRHVPQNIKHLLPPTAKHIRLYVKKMRDIEANQLISSLQLPKTTIVVSNNDSLDIIRKKLPLSNLEGAIGWRSVLINHASTPSSFKHIDAVRVKHVD